MRDTFDALSESEKARRRAEVRVLVLTGLGLNCEAETEAAFKHVEAISRMLMRLQQSLYRHGAGEGD